MTQLSDAVTIAQTLLRMNGEPPYERAAFEQAAATTVRTLALESDEELRTAIVAELEARHTVSIGRETVLEGEDDHRPWYQEERVVPGPFADRYFRYLRENEGWPTAAVASIQTTTQLIIGLLEDSDREG